MARSHEKPRPIVFSLQELTITRRHETATITYKDSAYGTTTLQIGPKMAQMTDWEILDLCNETLRAQAELARIPHVAVKFLSAHPRSNTTLNVNNGRREVMF